jgi:hypothetical protein
MLRLGFVVLAVLVLPGCPTAHSDYPAQSCTTNNDCYLGEHCLNNSICVPNGRDLAVPRVTADLSGADMVMP